MKASLAWMELVHLVIDGFPYLDEGQYVERLKEYIRNRRASAIPEKGNSKSIL